MGRARWRVGARWFRGARIVPIAMFLCALPLSAPAVRISSLSAGELCENPFLRGDVDGDGKVVVTDAVKIIDSLFSEKVTIDCLDAADANDDGRVNVADASMVLGHLFLENATFPAPFMDCGLDPTADSLGCAGFDPCGDAGVAAVVCGECETVCESIGGANVVAYGCHQGRCVIAECEPGYYDNDQLVENGCEAILPINGTPCDDNDPCTEDDRYYQGVCGGVFKDCSELDDDCFRGVCDSFTGECVQEPREALTPCDDGDPLTWADRCDGEGECIGIPIAKPGLRE